MSSEAKQHHKKHNQHQQHHHQQHQHKDGHADSKVNHSKKDHPHHHHHQDHHDHHDSHHHHHHHDHHHHHQHHDGHNHSHSHGHSHSHHGHHPEKGERHRRISQHSHTTDGGDNHEKHEKHRRISHHNRDGGHLKDATLRGHGRARAGSKREHDRHSVATSGDLNPPMEFENTYKIEPDSVFKSGEIKTIIKQVLQENLKGQKYEKNLMASRCLVLSDIIKEKVRQLNLDRFKIVTMVIIGENKNQSLLVSSRCLWNHSSDNFASSEYKMGNLCAVGLVFGVYQE